MFDWFDDMVGVDADAVRAACMHQVLDENLVSLVRRHLPVTAPKKIFLVFYIVLLWYSSAG
jgi:hypothetical protein